MTKLVFELPDKTTPGFFRRMRKALQFRDLMSEPTPESIDQVIDFLADFVKEPAEKQAAKDALYDATQEQIESLLLSVAGGGSNTVPPVNGGS